MINRKRPEKLTKKQDYSETITINASKTKKYPLQHSKNNYVFKKESNLTEQTGGADLFFGQQITDIKYDIFDIKTKKEYAQRVKDVRTTWIKTAIASKLGKISPEHYKMIKHLLYSNLYFSRMKLYSAKMTMLISILVQDKQSIVRKIHRMMRDIFNYQQEIDEIKVFEPKKVEKLIKKQDKTRYKLLALTLFKNSKDITKGCSGLGKTSIKSKKFICILSKYRKVESKFNKYYHKFERNIKAFFFAYQGCQAEGKKIKLDLLEIRKLPKQNDSRSLIDTTQCDSDKMYDAIEKSFEKIINVNEGILGSQYSQKTIEKNAQISEKYASYLTSLDETVEKFNEHIKAFNGFFRDLEYMGIHRYAGLLPGKKRRYIPFLGTKSYPLINPKKLSVLAKDTAFVEHFDSLLKNIAEKGKDIFIPVDRELSKIIPNIKLINPGATPAPGTAPTPSTAPTPTTQLNISIFTMNMVNYSKRDTIGNLVNVKGSVKDYPIVVCIQNGSKDMTNKTHIFTTGFLEDQYIPTSFSSHGNPEKLSYNIIFVRKDLIQAPADKPNRDEYIRGLQPANQSSRFFLNDLPSGMTIVNNQKSFTATNFFLDGDKGITIVSTELTGSKADDMFYANKIRDYEYIGLNEQRTKGLRGSQITKILRTIKGYTGYFPDFICGDMGGSSTKLLETSINKSTSIETYIEHVWDYFKKTYPDLIQYFNNSPDNFKLYLSQGIEDILLKDYDNITIEPNPSGDTYTKATPKLITNFIMAKKTSAGSMPASTTTPAQLNITDLINNITALGGNIPVYYNFTVNDWIHEMNTQIQARVKMRENGIKLFTETELQNILSCLDQLMENFAFGRLPYLRRDLGCFSFREKDLFGSRQIPEFYGKSMFSTGKSLLKHQLSSINYKNLDTVMNIPENQEAITKLKDFYCMDFPSVIENFLFQNVGFFSGKATDAPVYYSPNQTTTTAGTSTSKLKFGNQLNIIKTAIQKQNLINPDIAVRLLMMPSSHQKIVMGIDYTYKTSVRNYRDLTVKALNNYYGTYVAHRLETRLSEILYKRTTIGDQTDNNLIAHLMEKEDNGQLKNINDGEAILDLFELVFIFLRLKFIDQQIEQYDIKIKEEQKPMVEIEKGAKKSAEYKTGAIGLYDSIIEITAKNMEPFKQLLYDKRVQRDIASGTTEPTLIKDPRSFQSLIEKFKKDTIRPKPISLIKEQKLMGLQFMETYLSNALGIRLQAIATILEDQQIKDISQYTKTFNDNLVLDYTGSDAADAASIKGYEIKDLENTLADIYSQTQVAELTDIKVANDVYGRVKLIIDYIKQVNLTWKDYFLRTVQFLELYYDSIKLLISFETHENSRQYDKSLIKRDLELIMKPAQLISTEIGKIPYKLSTEVAMMFQQMKQIERRIESDLKEDVEFSFLNSLKGKLHPYNFLPEPSIYEVSLRCAYFIFNKIISLSNARPTNPAVPKPTTPNLPQAIDYVEIMNLCDLLEIEFDRLSKSEVKKEKKDDVALKNYDLLVKISRYIYICSSYLQKGIDAYDDILVATVPKIQLSNLYDNIVNALRLFNDSVGLESKELCSYVMRPLSILTNYAYHMVNVFTVNPRLNFNYDQLITDTRGGAGASAGASLSELYSGIKDLVNKGNELAAVNSIRSNSNIIISCVGNISAGNNSGVIDYQNVNRLLELESELSAKVQDLVGKKQVFDLDINNSENNEQIKDENGNALNYNIFQLKTKKTMQETDKNISESIRNFQANDSCTTADSTPLEYEMKFKPAIFSLEVGNVQGGEFVKNNMEKYDVGMQYLFLDVIDYFKNNKTAVLNEMNTDILNIINNTFVYSGFNDSRYNSFSTYYETLRYQVNDATYNALNLNPNNIVLGNLFNTRFLPSIEVIFKTNPNSHVVEPLHQYLTRGSPDNNKILVTNWRGAVDNRINNFIFILEYLLYLKRNTKGENGTQHSIINDFKTANPGRTFNDALTSLTDDKKFCINYFLHNNVLELNENMYIQLQKFRNFFLKVIYQNVDPDYFNNINKETRIKLIIRSIYTLSYLLNHDKTSPIINDTEKILEFGFIILGIGVLDHYNPATYFKIATMMEKETNWIDGFVKQFMPNSVSYYYKDAGKIDEINNDVIINYVKELCKSKASNLALDIYNDKPEHCNTYKLMNFINNTKDKKLVNTPMFNDLLEVVYHVRKLEVLLGTKDKGLLHDYNKKYELDRLLNATNADLLHQYYLIDYLYAINYDNIITRITNIYEKYEDILDSYKLGGKVILGNFDAFKEKTVNTFYEEIRDYAVDVRNNNNELSGGFDKEPTANVLSIIQNGVLQAIYLKDIMMYLCFEELFGGQDNYIPINDCSINEIIQNLFRSKLELVDTPSKPLYHFNKLMEYLQDCMEFCIDYYIPSKVEKNNIALWSDKMLTQLNMILDIFRNELNTTLLPIFTFSLNNTANPAQEQINKYIYDNILVSLKSTNDASKMKNMPNYSWKTPVLGKSNVGMDKSTDKIIYDFIYALLSAKDEDNNYYLIGDINVLDSYITDIGTASPDFTKFFNDITNYGFLLNNKDVNLNNNLIHSILKENEYFPFNINLGLGLGGVNYNYNMTYLKSKLYNSKLLPSIIDNLTNNLAYFNFCLYNGTSTNSSLYYQKLFTMNKIFSRSNQIVPTNDINEFNTHVQKLTNIEQVRKQYRDMYMYNIGIIPDINTDYPDLRYEICNNIQTTPLNFKTSFFKDILGGANVDILHQILDNFTTDLYYITTTSTNNPYNTLGKLFMKINIIYFDNTNITDFQTIQTNIKEAEILYNQVLQELTTYKYYLKHKLGMFEEKKSVGTNEIDYDQYKIFLLKPEIQANAFQSYNNTDNDKTKIKLLIKYEYDNCEELIEGIKVAVDSIFGLLPLSLRCPNINKSLTHRNNLFLATNILGFMNMKTLDYSIKYNPCLDIKLNLYSSLNLFRAPDDVKNLFMINRIYLNYFNSHDIFDNADIDYNTIKSGVNSELISKLTGKTEQQNFFVLRQNKSGIDPDIGIAKKYEPFQLCKLYTHPYFNYNSGMLFSLKNPPPAPINTNTTTWGTKGENTYSKILVSSLSKPVPVPPPLRYFLNNIYNISSTNTSVYDVKNYYKNILLHFLEYNLDDIDATKKDNLIQYMIKLLKQEFTKPELQTIGATIKERYIKFDKSIPLIKKFITDSFKSLNNLLQTFNKKSKDLILHIIHASTGLGLDIPHNYFNVITGKTTIDPIVFQHVLNFMGHTYNIKNLYRYAITLIQLIYQLIIVYNNLSEQYNISLYRFGSITPQQTGEFIYKYISSLSQNQDLDDINSIIAIEPDLLQNTIDILTRNPTILKSLGEINTYVKQNSIFNEITYLNTNYYDAIVKLASHIMTKRNTPKVDFNNTTLVSVLDNDILYSNDIIRFGKELLTLRGATLTEIKSKLLLMKYRSLDTFTKMQNFGNRVRGIYTSIAPKRLLEGGSITQKETIPETIPETKQETKTRKINSTYLRKKAKSSLIHVRYITKKDMNCNCGIKKGKTMKIIQTI